MFATKSAMVKAIAAHFDKWKQMGENPAYLRVDNA
jgi:hypothetical protein